MRDLKAVYTIWLRDLARFFRERNCIAGMLGQPLLYLLIVGNGFSASIKLPYTPPGSSYLQFMYPGIIGLYSRIPQSSGHRYSRRCRSGWNLAAMGARTDGGRPLFSRR